jgi:hypothetical protein
VRRLQRTQQRDGDQHDLQVEVEVLREELAARSARMKTLERELQLHPVKASQAQVMRLRGARFRGASGEGKHGRIEGVGEGAFEADDVQHDYAVWDTVGSLEDDEPGDDEAVAEGSSGQLVLPAVWPAVHDAADYATGGRAVELTTAMAAELSPEARRRHEQKLERYRQAKATAEAEMRKAAKAAKAERELQLKIARGR